MVMDQLTWMLSFIPEWFWAAFFILGILATLASWVLKFVPFISTYRLPIQVLGIIAISSSLWFLGAAANEKKWKKEAEALKAKVAEAENKQPVINTVVVENIVEKTKVVKGKTEYITQYIDKWNTKEIIKEVEGPERIRREEVIKYIENCPVPKEFIELHNKAATIDAKAEGAKK
jgi:hypothetical protein